MTVPTSKNIPIPAGTEEVGKVIEGEKPVETDQPPTSPSKKNPPLSSNTSSVPNFESIATSAAKSAFKYAPAAAA